MRTFRFAGLTVGLAVVVACLILAQRMLIPLAVAVVVWFSINAIAEFLGKIPSMGPRMSISLRKWVASFLILGFLWLTIEIIQRSVFDMLMLAPAYQMRLMELSSKLIQWIGPSRLPMLVDFIQGVDLTPFFSNLGSFISGFAGDFFLVVLYTVFLLVEQGTFSAKWKATFQTEEALQASTRTLDHISKSVREFVIVKTSTNLSVAVLSAIAMAVVGQDFALFWAFLIFLFNFIPTFGSFAAVGLPFLFAMLQFEGWTEPVAVLVGIATSHALIGYLVEPRLLGKRLNMSPLVILISLSVWGMIWGIIGMILAVPIMVTLMIVLAAIPYTRPVAVWLSSEGKVGDDGMQEGD
jgi:predicted PurR-regulated permease PerM